MDLLNFLYKINQFNYVPKSTPNDCLIFEAQHHKVEHGDTKHIKQTIKHNGYQTTKYNKIKSPTTTGHTTPHYERHIELQTTFTNSLITRCAARTLPLIVPFQNESSFSTHFISISSLKQHKRFTLD